MDEHQGIGDLLSDRAQIDQEIEMRLKAHLMNLAEAYVKAFGSQGGMELFSSHLTTEVARKHFPGGWTGFVLHLKTISG
jgi:hypothetical protein